MTADWCYRISAVCDRCGTTAQCDSRDPESLPEGWWDHRRWRDAAMCPTCASAQREIEVRHRAEWDAFWPHDPAHDKYRAR